MSEAPKKSDQQTNIGMILVTIASFFSTVIYRGAAKKSTWTGDRIKIWVIYLVGVALIAFAPRWNVSSTLIALSPRFVPVGFGEWVHLHTYRVFHIFVLFFPPFLLWLFSLGIFDWIQLTKYQNRLKHLGLKTPTGITPQVVRVIQLDNNQKKILVQAIGIDVTDFRNRKGAIEASFNAIVQSISVTHSNKQMVEILTSEKELPTLIRFESCQDKLLRPYTFLVGEAMDGFIVADLCEIHHMLVAGATGGGKSVFFKQALVGLLKSSKFIQLYLVDLKRGVDMKPFDALENVEVIKDTMSAISTLTVVVAEMERRFKFLEEKGFTEIVPERDNLDRIVVGVDEASVLFTVEKSSKATRDQAQNARELTDKIAKLGRAAGIHVILATQKVVKETIDTRVQTNINARMCFRVNTVASSMTVLGNKKAAELPDTKGRGIWSVGSNDIIVQVPKLDNEEVIEEVNALTQKFNGTSSPLKQAMLKVTAPVKKRGQGFVAEEAAASETEKGEV